MHLVRFGPNPRPLPWQGRGVRAVGGNGPGTGSCVPGSVDSVLVGVWVDQGMGSGRDAGQDILEQPAGVSRHEGGGRRHRPVGAGRASSLALAAPWARGKGKGVAPGRLWPDAIGQRAWARGAGPDVVPRLGRRHGRATARGRPRRCQGFLCRVLPGAPGWSCICHSRQWVHIGRGWGKTTVWGIGGPHPPAPLSTMWRGGGWNCQYWDLRIRGWAGWRAAIQ